MLILMIGSTDSQATAEKIINLASESLTRGHQTIVFFNAESTRLLEPDGFEELSGLLSRGARLLACRTSAQEAGLRSQGDLIDGAEMSSLGELVDLFEASDRTLFLG
jgi:sulfur relay (sulfurtransferase) complex TusBCD TusD component (DsrE family)